MRLTDRDRAPRRAQGGRAPSRATRHDRVAPRREGQAREPLVDGGEAQGLSVGQVVYDHLAQRTGRVAQAGPGGVVLVDAAGTTRWTASGLYRLALEPLEAPSALALAFAVPRPAARRDALRALDPLALAVALCRGERTGPCRARGDRVGGVLLAEPVSQRELARAHEAALGAPGEHLEQEVRARLASLHTARPGPRTHAGAHAYLRADPAGLRLVLSEPSWLLERLVLDRTWRRERGRGRAGAAGVGGASGGPGAAAVAPLVRGDATSHAPYTAEEEAALAWALAEVVRIERGDDPQPVDRQRLGELRSRLWAVFRPGVAQRTDRRLDPELGWIDPDTVPEEVLERLLELLRAGAGGSPAVERLRARLAPGAAPAAPTSQLVRNALYDCLDAVRDDREHTAPRLAALEPAAHDRDELVRPADAAPALVRDVGFEELRGLVAQLAPRADQAGQERRARALLRSIRRVFARELEALRARDPVRYRTVLLDFTTLLSRPQIAHYTGIRYNTFREWFPRAGTRPTRPPHFVRALLPDELQGFVRQFGRVYPILQVGLLPRADEVDALTQDEATREALVDLFVLAPLDGRGGFWGDGELRRAAGRTQQSVEAFIDQTLFPFLVALVEHRRARDLARGEAPWLERPRADTPEEQADRWAGALALLLLGAPDGRGLGAALAARPEPDARRAVARAAGLTPLDLVDLELGRRWAGPQELEALRRVLAPHLDLGALDGLAPDPAPGLREGLSATPGAAPAEVV